MDEKKRKMIIFAIFVLAVAFGLYSQPWKHFGARGGMGISDTTAGIQTSAATVSTVAENSTTRDLVRDWTVDPFRSRPTTPATGVPMIATEEGPIPALQGTMIVGNEPVCVIGGQILRRNSQFGGWRVDAVAAGRVEITRLTDHKHLTLRAGRSASTERR